MGRAALLGSGAGSAKRTIAASGRAGQAAGMDAHDAILDRYRAACAAAGVQPLPDAEAAAMLALILAVLAGDDSGLTVQ